MNKFFNSRIWALTQTFRAIWRFKTLFTMAFCLAGLALTIPVFLSTLAWALSEPVVNVPIRTEITVFTERSAGPKTVQSIAAEISAKSAIESIEIVPKSKALEMVNQSLGLKQGANKSNPLPDIVIATVAKNVTSQEIKNLAAALEAIPHVDTVAYDDQWAEYLSTLFRALSIIAGILGCVVVLLVLLVIFASVRLTTNAQREEIKALYLFGATNAFIKRPYVWRGFLTLAIAALVSLGVTMLGISLLAKPVADFASLYGVSVGLRMPGIDWCILYVAIAAMLGALAGSVAAGDAIKKIRPK